MKKPDLSRARKTIGLESTNVVSIHSPKADSQRRVSFISIP